MIEFVRHFVTRLRWNAKESISALRFVLSSECNRWQREWEFCSSVENYFNFASSRLGIGQNKDEFLRFLSYLDGREPINVLEIGVRHGGTNFMFSNCLKTCQHIMGVDIRLQNIHLLKAFKPVRIRRQDYICGQSTHPSTIKRVKRCIGSEKLDVLFIDGDHSYYGIVNDFNAYHQFVRDGGIIAFHDICMDHRKRYGIETSNDSGDVYLFWQKIRKTFEIREFFTDEKQNGAGIGTIVWDPSKSFPD